MTFMAMRRVAPQQPLRRRTRNRTFPAPVRGWITNENMGVPQGNSCRVLENWFPEYDGVRLRGGSLLRATIGTDPVESMFRYNQGGVEELFAASETDIYDISAFDTVTPPSASVSSQTNGHYSALQMATSGGEFLYVFNEADAPQLYNGSTWTQITGASSPAITGVTTTLLRQGWTYRNRIFMIERDSLIAWYLPTESVGGAAADISLAGVFTKGGTLLFGATWSLDAGDGIDDKCVFVTDAGEVAIYEGGDPGTITDWRLVGRYDCAIPISKNAHMRAGGDLLIATVEGIIPLTEIIRKDPAALSLSAVTRPIEPNWKLQANQRLSTKPWEMIKWPEKNMGLVSLPHTASDVPKTFAVNLQTGAWALFTGMDTQCMAEFAGDVYFGDSNGKVFQMETGGADNEEPYICKMGYYFDHMDEQDTYKIAGLARASFLAAVAFNPLLSCESNFSHSFPAAPDAVADSPSGDLWDVGLWDVALWDGGSLGGEPVYVQTLWQSVQADGIVLAPQIQVTCGSEVKPDAKLIQFVLTYEQGELVV